MGKEAVRIGEAGFYISPSGQRVEIGEVVASAVAKTQAYPAETPVAKAAPGAHPTHISVANETTLSAARRLIEKGLNTAVLNFASATSPGGGFLEGGRAQEEYLARSSCLYQCIRGNPMYRYHREHYNPFCSDYMVYSPAVPVVRGDDGVLLEKPYTVSIITSAAVNAERLSEDRKREISTVMQRRIVKVLGIGVAHGHDGIVLGAWGCGAFGCDATEIAKLFRQALVEPFRGAFREVIFAIVDWSSEKRFIGPFEKVFGKAAPQ
jgi:uncharacterized protein (TIGR02452 family)